MATAASGAPHVTPLVRRASTLGANLTDANLSGGGGTLGSAAWAYESTTRTGKLPTDLTRADGVANELVRTANGAIGPVSPTRQPPGVLDTTVPTAATSR